MSVNKKIPYARPDVNIEDKKAVLDALDRMFLTQGELGDLFENTVAEKVGADYAVASNSASSSLLLACLAMELKRGDWVWTSPISFVASANCALHCGANVDFVDVDVATGNMCINALERKLEVAKRAGMLPKILIPVHMCGHSCDMISIESLSVKYGFRIIEDASHALGGKYDGNFVGDCRYSDICIFSFHAIKIVTTGEGGIATTNDPLYERRMRLLRSHGVTRNHSEMQNIPHGLWYYEQKYLGFNMRMTDFQSALGLSQVNRIDDYVIARNKLAKRYHEMLVKFPVWPLKVAGNAYSSFHLYVIRFDFTIDMPKKSEIASELLKKGISSSVHYIPIHLQPYYKKLGFQIGDFPQSEKYYQQALSLPMFPQLCRQDQAHVVESLGEIIYSCR